MLQEVEREACKRNAEDAEVELMLDQLTRQHVLREAVSEMTFQCRCLVHMLFLDSPALPYEEVAKRLGVAKGVCECFAPALPGLFKADAR